VERAINSALWSSVFFSFGIAIYATCGLTLTLVSSLAILTGGDSGAISTPYTDGQLYYYENLMLCPDLGKLGGNG
jgi:hypothetical protein